MGFTENAFSVHNFINSVGADAGFASIIGLAILALLYFAQARETASLREHAKEAATRIMELERRVAQLTQAGPAPAPSPAAPVASVRQAANPIAAAGSGSAAGVPAPISAAAVAALGVGEISASHHGQLAAMAPSAPAGVGAPPLNAATKLISTQSRVAAPVEHVPAAVPVATPPQAAPGANGTEHAAVLPQPAAAPVSAPVQRRPPVQIRPGASTAGRPGGGAARPGGPPRGPAPRSAEHGPWSRGLIAALVVLAVAAVVVVLVIFTGSGGGTTTQASSPTPTSNAPTTTHHSAGPKPFNNATVTVAVLNGTPVSGLAGRTAARLTAAGFKQGTVATAGDQTRKATIVAYMPGHSTAAAAVAKELKLGSASVQPVDASTQAIACQTTPCTATVVVTVGADLSSQ